MNINYYTCYALYDWKVVVLLLIDLLKVPRNWSYNDVCIILFRRSGASAEDLYDIFTYRIRPIVEYAYPVWHTRLIQN